jgi:hypothetical protein
MRRTRLQLPFVWRRPRGSGASPARLAELLPAERRGLARDQRLVERLRACVHPDLYAAQLRAEGPTGQARLDVDGALDHFLASGAREGKRVCALFNPGWYLDALADRGLRVPDGVVPFFHWLSVGWEQRIVPTPLFDEEFYRASHPGLSQPWLFSHYLTRGCYRAQWRPSPLGRHHSGVDDPTALAGQRPLLLREMLHRSGEFDLTRTSWLEEGCVAALRTYRTLDTPTMRGLVAKAAAIEPLITQVDPVRRPVSCPPHRHPRLYLAEQAGRLQRELAGRRVGTVVLVPRAGEDEAQLGERLVRALGASATGETLLVATDVPPASGRRESAMPFLDLATRAQGLDADQRRALALDLLRGLEVRRIITVGSRTGWDLLATYGRQLSTQAELGAVVLDAGSAGPAGLAERLNGSLAFLDWVVLDDGSRRALADRYLLPEVSRRRLFPMSILSDEGGAGPAGGLAEQLARVPRRGA